MRRPGIGVMIALACVLTSLSCAHCSAMDKSKMEKSLHYPGSYDVSTRIMGHYNAWQTNFKINVPYPSLHVLSFYDTNLQRLGWVSFAEKGYASSYRVWRSFIDDTQRGSPKVYQLLAKWKKQDELISLSIRYYSPNIDNNRSSPDNEIAHVSISVMPFVPLSRLEAANEGPDSKRTPGGIRPPAARPVIVGQHTKWIDSYNLFKKSIRPTDPADDSKCEKLLYDILKGIDDNGYCKKSTDCSMLNQEPFGATVPIRRDAAFKVLVKMQSYKKSCDNGTFHGAVSTAIKNIPVCCNGMCMVKSISKNAP